MINSSVSLYIHIPFCQHRCGYCDFNTYARRDNLIPEYVQALVREIGIVARAAPEPMTVKTIFFGGGTPSLLTSGQIKTILSTIRKYSNVDDPETTLEANPGTVSEEYLAEIRELGINRLSFGVQSFHAKELILLQRIHDPTDSTNALEWARQAGFRNINLDLIFGLPAQSLQDWKTTLKKAVDINPEHLSLYALTIETGTPFYRAMDKGSLPAINADDAADMYETAMEYLEENGYQQYEISNWARDGEKEIGGYPRLACLHNLRTWRNQPYLGFGAGAHGYAAGTRYSNVMRINNYLNRMNSEKPESRFPVSPAAAEQHHISRQVEMQETMMLGLRLTQEGVSAQEFSKKFGVTMESVFGNEIRDLLSLTLVEWGNKNNLRLTKRGRLLGNQAFVRFI